MVRHLQMANLRLFHHMMKVGKAMIGTYTGLRDVATPSGAMSQELLEPRTIRQGRNSGFSRPGGSGVKRKESESADSLVKGVQDEIPCTKSPRAGNVVSPEDTRSLYSWNSANAESALIRMAESLDTSSLGLIGSTKTGGKQFQMPFPAAAIAFRKLPKTPRNIWIP